MPRSQKNDNFIDKTFTIVADILLRTMPTSSREKEAFAYYRDGMSAQAEGEYAEALQNYYEAMRLEVDPYDRSYILYNIGLIHTSNGEHTRALEYYYQALERNAALPQALNNIAVICHYRGEQAIEQGDPEAAEQLFDQAAEYWKQALSLAPTNYMEAQNWLVVTGRASPSETFSPGSFRSSYGDNNNGVGTFKLDGMKTDAFRTEASEPVAKNAVSYSPPLGSPNSENPLVFLDVKLGRYGEGKKLGRIVIEVRRLIGPESCKCCDLVNSSFQLCKSEWSIESEGFVFFKTFGQKRIL
jgi:tetratricopeptide (TPR) repeat protein